MLMLYCIFFPDEKDYSKAIVVSQIISNDKISKATNKSNHRIAIHRSRITSNIRSLEIHNSCTNSCSKTDLS